MLKAILRPRAGRRAFAVTLVGAGLIALVAARWPLVPPPCDPGRECIRSAGISLVLPAGWQRLPSDAPGYLFAAAPSPHATNGLFIRRGAADLGSTPVDLSAVVYQLKAEMTRPVVDTPFGSDLEGTVDRAVLPIGPAARFRYTAEIYGAFWSDHVSVVSYWCFVEGQLLEIEYIEMNGEAGRHMLADAPTAVRGTFHSLRPLSTPGGSPTASVGSGGLR